jgi:hypothetical protein
MLFNRNLPVWERVLRSVVGLAIVAFGLLAPGLAASPIGYIIAAAGVVACAVAGRRLK